MERNYLIQIGAMTPAQADAITPSDVMRAYRMGCRGLEQANEQAEKFERFNYLTLHDLERLLDASEALSNYDWLAVTVDCDEARSYLQELLDGLRAEIKRLRKPQEHLVWLGGAQ